MADRSHHQSVQCQTPGCRGYLRSPGGPSHDETGAIFRKRVCQSCQAVYLTEERIVKTYRVGRVAVVAGALPFGGK
jgi:hypothetical protein